ncbi:MAG: sortase [Christensenellales bacterium]|jgi:LPXTG-site transpeptidase (sortase) family protein
MAVHPAQAARRKDGVMTIQGHRYKTKPHLGALALVLCLCTAIFSAIQIISIQRSYQASAKEYDTLRVYLPPQVTPPQSTQGRQAAVEPETQEPPPSARVPVLEDVQGYLVIAKLVIESLSLDLLIIGEVSDAALKVSSCLYMGPSSPAYPGNIVITGHNNRDKSHFGRLNELQAGSVVVLSDPYGSEYRYEVYGTETIGPNEVEALEIYEGEYGLALVTCTDRGENRLLLRCRRLE